MKTEEDEAFDDLAKRQGSWGGGFPAKRAMAADKFIAAEERKVGERYGYVPKLHPSEWMNAQPAQEPVAVISAWSLREVYFDEDGEPSMHRSPPQRPWVGLTEEETSGFTSHEMTVVKYVSKVLQEKNT